MWPEIRTASPLMRAMHLAVAGDKTAGALPLPGAVADHLTMAPMGVAAGAAAAAGTAGVDKDPPRHLADAGNPQALLVEPLLVSARCVEPALASHHPADSLPALAKAEAAAHLCCQVLMAPMGLFPDHRQERPRIALHTE